MIPTSDTTLVFVDRDPSWEGGCELELVMETRMHTSRAGLEERQQGRAAPLLEMSYTAVLSASDAAARADTARTEMNAVCVVPVWPRRAYTTTSIASNKVTIDATPGDTFWRPGDWVYFRQGPYAQFRQIESVAGSELTLLSNIAPHTFLTGAKIWPCRLFTRQQGIDWRQAGAPATSEEFKLTSL